MPKKTFHSFILLLATTGTYFWITTPSLTNYTLQLTAILILIYALTHWSKKPSTNPTNTIPLDLTLLTIIILLLVVETGSLASPIIFLLYFLLFAVAMLFEIEATLTLTGTLLVFLLLLPSTDLGDIAHLSELLAFIMITPLALYTSHQHELILKTKHQAQQLSQHLANEETDILLFLSTNLNTTLTSALDNLSNLIPILPTQKLQTKLTSLYSDLRALYRSAQDLSQIIDHETD